MTTNNTFSNQKREENNTFCNLTELWKKGELEVGEEYWVILTDEWYLRSPVVPVRAFYSCECEFEGYLDNDIKQVLAPVPSYEEWQSLNELLDSMQDTNKVLAHRLNLCKDLLKECNKTFFEIRLSLSSGKINSVFDLSYQCENDINEVLK